jgi:hypothetical protein
MSRSNTHRSAGSAGTPRSRARRAAAGLQPAVAHIRPLVRTAGAAARRQSGRARAWAAPQLEHAGQALQGNIAPKAAALLSAAARRVEPARPQRSRWRKLVGASAVTATASALAAAARRRVKGAATAPDPEDATDAAPDPEDATDAAPDPEDAR